MCVGYISVAAFKNFMTSYLHYILPAKPAFFRFQTQSLSPSLPCYLTKQWPCDCRAAAAWVFPVPVNTQGIITGLLKQISSQQHKGSIYMQVLSVSNEGGESISTVPPLTALCVLVCGIHLDKCTRNYTCKTDRSKVCWGQTADAEPRQWLMLG